MDTKRFILLMSCLTGLFCALIVAYNLSAAPPYGGSYNTPSAVPLFTQTTTSSNCAETTQGSGQGSSSTSENVSGSSAATSSTASSKTSKVSGSPSSSVHYPINLNTATLTQLEALSGIGPSKAQAIIDYRTAHGGFKNVNELDNVKGIGTKTIDKLRPYLTV